MPSKLAIALVAIIFLVTLIVRLPASVLAMLLPNGLACQEASGTLWQGGCGQLRSGSLALSDLHWTLHPLALLRARAQLDVQSDDPRALGRGALTLHTNGDADIEGLTASLPVQGGLTPLPAGWSGQIQLAIAHALIKAQRPESVEGKLTVQQLHMPQPATDLGSFELDFPPAAPGAPSIGTLRDLGGPLALQGSVSLAHGSYELNATLAARDPANTDLEKLLQLLGPTDAQGRHQLSLAGTF